LSGVDQTRKGSVGGLWKRQWNSGNKRGSENNISKEQTKNGGRIKEEELV